MLVPARAAISDKVSPGCTTYDPALDGLSFVSGAASSSLETLSPTPAPDAAASCVRGGIINVLPASRDASEGNPLAAAS